MDIKKYIQDPANLLSEMYCRMVQRTERKDMSDLCFSKNDFMYWAYSIGDYFASYDLWEESEFSWKMRPTIDRIDSTQGYISGNMQILALVDNKEKEIWDVIKNPRKDNRSGTTGVIKNNTPIEGRGKPWTAYIKVKKNVNKTKRFFTKEEAITQRKEWEKEYYVGRSR